MLCKKNNKMKIVIVVFKFPPKWLAGTELATQNIAKRLVQAGHDVFVVTSYDKGLPKESKENGFYVYRIFCSRIKFFGTAIFWIKSFLILTKIKPDVVHCQGISTGISGYWAKKFLKIPYIVYGRGSDVYLNWSFKKLISKMVFENAGAVLVLINDMKDCLKKYNIKEVFVIGNGIDYEKFSKHQKQKNGFLSHKIIFVGNLKPVKGLNYLIEAISVVKNKFSDVELIIAGDGPEKKNLQELSKNLNLQNSIKFLGRIENEKVAEYMSVADLFVLPSLSEGFPMVLLEAMAVGLPIVATEIRGVPEIVKNGESGFLAEPKNSHNLAQKIIFMLENKELMQKISEHNKKTAKEYSWQNVAQNLNAIYYGVVNKKI